VRRELVKLADLDDHLAHATIPSDAPPYAWARKRLLASAEWSDVSQERRVSPIESRVKRLTREPVSAGVVTVIVIVCGTTRSI
jgi:hypothetical protein